MLTFMLLLSFPREITGATFFRQYDPNGNHTLSCNRPDAESETEYLWFKGQGSSSLQTFEPIGNDSNPSARQCSRHSSGYRNKTLPTSVSSNGGIFACSRWTKDCTLPLFTVVNRCKDFDFFIVAIRDDAEEEKAFGVIDAYEPVTAIPEKGNFTLTCRLQVKHHSIELTLYWIKEAVPSLCIFSASNDNKHSNNFFKDGNCCVDAAIKERRSDHPVNFSEGWLNHSLTIVNASSSDSGKYLCVVTIWRRKRVWKIASNMSVEVQKSTLSHESTTADRFMKELQISLGGVIGGVILVCGIIWLLCWKKKAKGNPAAEHPRNRMEIELEGDDCSPYAVSSRNDIEKNETLYSVVMKPPGHFSTLSDGKPASKPGEKLHTVYALVSK